MEFRQSREDVLAAIKKHGHTLQSLDDCFKNDREIV